MFLEALREPVAFWILTYGSVRLVAGYAGLHENIHWELLFLAALTYLFECVFYVNKNEVVSLLSAIGFLIFFLI